MFLARLSLVPPPPFARSLAHPSDRKKMFSKRQKSENCCNIMWRAQCSNSLQARTIFFVPSCTFKKPYFKNAHSVALKAIAIEILGSQSWWKESVNLKFIFHRLMRIPGDHFSHPRNEMHRIICNRSISGKKTHLPWFEDFSRSFTANCTIISHWHLHDSVDFYCTDVMLVLLLRCPFAAVAE